MKLKNIAIGIATLFCLSGCSDFLETDRYGAGIEEQFWKTEKDIKEALDAFHSTYVAREGTSGRAIMWFENCSDNMVTGRSSGEADDIKNFNMGASNGRDVKSTWPQLYQLIRMTNKVLHNAPNVSMSDAMKNRAYGESRFYRGFAYLWLAPYYGDNGPSGGLPILTEDTPDTAEGQDQPRPSSVLANYDMIIDDMRKAGEDLRLFSQLDKSEYGRPHKAAAWAFGARAALYAAQYDAKYYDIVIEFCDKIMALTGADKRDLFDDGSENPFANLFRKENNFCEEYIFSILGNEIDGPKFHGMSFQNGGYGLYNTWGYFQPTKELYDAFDPVDKRREATILYPGEKITFVGKELIWAVNPEEVSSPTKMTFRKFMSIFEAADCIGKDVNTNGDNASNRLGQTLIRYADVLLMKAEALIWKNGEGDTEAKKLLNQIRKRARLPENSPATKDELKNQRRCELAFEFMPSRHLDLVRWGDAKDAYAKPLHGFETTTDGNTITSTTVIEVWKARTFDPTKHHIFPIPAAEVAKSKNLTQNKGY